MRITYDPDADAMYIYLKEGTVDKTQEMGENTNIDLDKKGEVLGVEILFVKERSLLNDFKIENLVSSKKVSLDLTFLNNPGNKNKAIEIE
ncbi:MAG TPA: DUF2283 domain-containing protein [Candidatus Nanoarchaeia archaeon]|nr:DUF2283 domain-containing protein [Candidatus Nanoarchaeia archaeon]